MAKKKAKIRSKAKRRPEDLFSEWWNGVAEKKVTKIEKAWLSSTEPNGEDDEDEGTDSWHVNQMMHSGDAHEMTYEIAERVFMLGYEGKKWEDTMGDSLFCDLDDVVAEAYEHGRKMGLS